MHFVERLHFLLSEDHDYIKWWHDGESFSINEEEFTAEVLTSGTFDNIQTWESFVRVLMKTYGCKNHLLIR